MVEDLNQKCFEKLEKILKNSLRIENNAKITREGRFREDYGLDSLDEYELLYGVEEGFGIQIPDEKARDFESLKDVEIYLIENYKEVVTKLE